MQIKEIQPGDIIYSKRHKRPIVVERIREAGVIGRMLGVQEKNTARKELIVYPEDIEGVRKTFKHWQGQSAL